MIFEATSIMIFMSVATVSPIIAMVWTFRKRYLLAFYWLFVFFASLLGVFISMVNRLG